MRIGLLGAIGYAASLLLLFFILFNRLLNYPIVTFIYPVSIGLRSVFWRRIGFHTKHAYFTALSILLSIFGGLISLIIILYLLDVFFKVTVLPLSQYNLLIIIISLWAVYSVAEIVGYISYARLFNIRSAYLGALGLLTILIIVYQAIVLESSNAFLIQPLNTLASYSLIFLAASLIAMSYSSFILKIDIAVKKPEREEIDELEKLLAMELSNAERTAKPSIELSSYFEKKEVTHHRVDSPQKLKYSPIIIVEVISRSNEVFCHKCGAVMQVGSNICSSCGARLYEFRPGLKCPVCRAPISYSKRISSNHRVCSICFSDLRLRPARPDHA